MSGETARKGVRGRAPCQHLRGRCADSRILRRPDGRELSWKVQVGGLVEDSQLERLQLEAGVDTELVGQELAGAPIGGQCIGLATRTVKGHHELTPQ